MNKLPFILPLLLCISFSLLSQPTVNNQDSISKQPASPKDRNMFGLHIPRGLKINSDGLADGYIMYAVTNSPFIYLINRKGEVVHQWKGNYAVFSAYLQDD